eukprot:7599728-Heterocapsa_arctica.AAC.1
MLDHTTTLWKQHIGSLFGPTSWNEPETYRAGQALLHTANKFLEHIVRYASKAVSKRQMKSNLLVQRIV